MGTGVVVDGYEIQNWHTVAILELAQTRREQARGRASESVHVEKQVTKRRNRNTMKELKIGSQMKISYGQACELHRRYLAGESLAEIAGEYGITMTTAVNYFRRLELTYPRPKSEGPEVAAVPPTPDEQLESAPPDTETQMDEPEALGVAEDAEAVARSRARALHASAGDSRVIAVQELPSVLARKPYMTPRILESGSMLNVGNPHAAAKLVENLVAELNRVPGVQAYFEWRAEGQMGQPLGR